ncbi:hypothetical protein BAE30_14135 [Acidithiobacillus caldus]|uniref:Uncharacterized protein n=1 Tax=Acidithiobacillus caldus TaxID=33059 RepID=A0A1E7YSF1_9PROT|nr:hypothetical protein BAE30_14135 [Acidithiobacillus caldus]
MSRTIASRFYFLTIQHDPHGRIVLLHERIYLVRYQCGDRRGVSDLFFSIAPLGDYAIVRSIVLNGMLNLPIDWDGCPIDGVPLHGNFQQLPL